MPVRTTHSGIPVRQTTSTSPTLASQSQEPQTYGYTTSGIPIRNPNVGAAGTAVNVDPNSWEEYSRLSDHPFLGDPDQYNLAGLQSGGEQAKNAFVGAMVNIPAGFMEAVGSWDLEDGYDMAAGVNKEYGNWAHDLAKNMGDWQERNFPVYEKNPGSFAPGDPGWWGNMAKTIGFTAGFAGEAAAEQIGFGLLTGGAGNEVSAMAKIRTLANLKRLAGLSTLGEAAFGAFKGMQEATTNGYETYDATYKKYLDLGYTGEQATKMASTAASVGWRTEVGPLMLMNALQYSTLAHNPAGISKGLIERGIGGIENKYVRGGVKAAEQMLSEGAEEGWQTIASEEGKYKADVMAGLQTPKDFSERLGDYVTSAEFYNSAFAGALGGLAFMGVGSVKQQLQGIGQQQQRENSWDDYKSGMQGMMIEYLGKIREAEKAGDTGTATALKQEMSLQQALQSYHIDHLKNDPARGTYEAHTTTLQGILKAVEDGNQEAMDAYKIGEDDKDFVKSQFPEMISKAKDAARIYDSIKGTNDASVLVPMAYRMQLTEDFSNRIGKSREQLDKHLDSIPGTADLSSEGKAQLKLKYQLNALNWEEARIKERMGDAGVQLEEEGLKERLEQIKGLREKGQQESKELSEKINTAPDKGLRDWSILSAIPDNGEASLSAQRRAFNETELQLTRKELAFLSDKEYQGAASSKKMQKLLDQSLTPQQVDNVVKADAKANGGKPSQKVQEAAAKKKKTLAAENAVAATNAKLNQSKPQNTSTPTDNNLVPPGLRPGTGKASTAATTPNLNDPGDLDAIFGPKGKPFDPGMISPRMRRELNAQGFDDAEIDGMTPAEAQQNLNWRFDDTNTGNISAARAGQLGDDMDFSTVKTGGRSDIDLNGGEVFDDPNSIMLPDYDTSSEKGRASWEAEVARRLSNYLENMSVTSGKPVEAFTFRDMLKDLILHKGPLVTENNFDMYVLGWKLNGYAETDFDADYKILFGDRNQLADDLNELAYGMVGKPQGLIEQQDKDNEMATDTGRDPLAYVYTEGGEVRAVRKGYKRDHPLLTLQFQNQGYVEKEIYDEETGESFIVRENTEGLMIGADYDSREIMLPHLYQPGTKLTAKVPDNVEDVEITIWNGDYSQSRRMKFGDWAFNNNIEEGSAMWTAMIPILVYNAEGKPVAQIHDTEWYNPENVGGESDPEGKQTKLILEGRANVMAMRKTLMEGRGALDLTVTVKKPGSKTLNKGEAAKTINQEDPSSVIAYRTKGNVIINSSGQEILPGQIMKKETDNRELTLEVGDAYDLRQVGMVTLDVTDPVTGKVEKKSLPQYMPLGVTLPQTLDEHSQQSIVMATAVYLAQYDNTGAIMDVDLRRQIHDDVERISGLDLYDEVHFRSYLNQFIKTPFDKGYRKTKPDGTYDKPATMQAVYNHIAGAANIPDGTPFMTVYDNTFIVGIKGQDISPKSAAFNVKFQSPKVHQTATGSGAQQYVNAAHALLNFLEAPHNPADPQDMSIVSRMRNNVSHHIAAENNSRMPDGKNHVALISRANMTVTDGGLYADYLKDRLTTRVKGYAIGDGHATFVQPQVQFTYSEAAVAEAAEQKIVQQELQAQQTPVPTQTSPLSDNKDVADALAKLEALKGNLADLGIDLLPNYEADTDKVIEEAKAPMTKVKGMDLSSVVDTVNFIARKIEGKVDTKYGSSVSKANVLSSVKGLLEETFSENSKTLLAAKEYLETVVAAGDTTKQAKLDQVNSILAQTELAKANWPILVKEAMEKVLSATDIIESTKDMSHYASDMLSAIKAVGYRVPDKADYDALKKAAAGEEEHYPAAAKLYEYLNENIEGIELEDLEVHESEAMDDGSERAYNFSKTSLQENNKGSVSYLFRRFLNKIPEYTLAGTKSKEVKGFAGLTRYPGFGYYFDKIQSILTDGTDCPPDFKKMMDKLKDWQDNLPWLQEFIKNLEKEEYQMQAAFSYGLNLHGANFKFMMFRENDGVYGTKVYDTNSAEINRKIQDDWFENFKMTDLMSDDGENLNPAEALALMAEYDSWKSLYALTNHGAPPKEVAQAWLQRFGITLSDETMTELKDSGYAIPYKNTYTHVAYTDMFKAPSHTSYSIFEVLRYALGHTIQSAPMRPDALYAFGKEADGNPLKTATGILGRYSNIEKKYTSSTTTASVRDGDKSLFGLTNPTMSSHVELKLKADPEHRAALDKVEFHRGSFVLQLLIADTDFRNKFDMFDMGINSIKQIGRKNTRPTEFTTLSDADQEYTRVGMFHDNKQGEVKVREVNVYGRTHRMLFRMGTMMFPTMADKKAMKMMKTAVIKLRAGKEMLTSPEGKVILSENALAFAFSQLVEPELRRIAAHHNAAKNKNADTLVNIDGYNKGAQIFIGIPQLNKLQIQGQDLVTYLATATGTMTPAFVNDTIAEIKEEAHNFLQNFFAAKVTKKVGTDTQKGTWEPFIDRNENGTIRAIEYLDTKYLEDFSEPDKLKTLTYAALEYVYNTHIHNANNMQLFGMDIAHFSQDKAFLEDDFHAEEKDGKKGKPVPWLGKTQEAYYKAVKNFIDVNLGKRLAMLIAPRKSLHNSRGDKYIKLCLEDRKSAADNIEYQIELSEGKAALKDAKVQEWLADLKNLDDKIPGEKEKIAIARKGLMEKFPKIADFFEINSTDAQEYVTGKEAIDTLLNQGRMKESVHKEILGKLKRGADLTYSELNAVKQIMVPMQPSKPVHTGVDFINTDAGNLARPVYVKCSAIPLLPQTTKGKEIDHLRRVMEDIQDKSGTNVRASYHSATKAGDVLSVNRLKIWDNQGRFIKGSISRKDILAQVKDGSKAKNIIIMDRENFGIQQDVPSKVDKRGANTVSQVSQAMKALFGDGVLKIKDKIFTLNGEPATAVDLNEHFKENYGILIRNEKSRLYDEIGIDENSGEPIDVKATAEKLQAILKAEALALKMPKSVIEGLSLQTDGQFSLPVWMSPENNKFETLLNSIVSSRLVHIKFPGSQYVAASEEGFRTMTMEDLGDTVDHGKMIYTDKWEGELKAAQFGPDGRLIKSQVIISQQFQKPDGTFIDLIKDNYAVQREDGRWMLDMNKVDESLLSISSFRIPLSGHVSMSQLEIVAFLPAEQTGLAILPKNLITQKGLDFDIDKESTYQLWHKVHDGKLVPVSRENTKETPQNKSKFAQNEIVKVFHSFLSSESEEIQKRINKVLSFDFERGQRNLFNDLFAKHDEFFSIYDDEHQKDKMALGAAGQQGIAVYANMLSYHNLIQQNPKQMQLKETVTEMVNGEKKTTTETFEFWLGGHKSNGILGETTTHDGNRSVTEVMGGKLTMGTDNEKEQVMGAVGIDSFTISTDVLLTMLRYDKANLHIKGQPKEVGITYLLLSQPIIKDFVKAMKATRGATSDFTPNAKDKVKAEMVAKYRVGTTTKLLEGYDRAAILNLQRAHLSADRMLEEISNGGGDPLLQQVALDLFLKLDDMSRKVTEVYSNINIQNEGLGKSIPEMLSLYDSVRNMGYSKSVTGIDGLVGDFIVRGKDYKLADRPHKMAEGYMAFTDPRNGGEFMVKPNTVIGHQVISAVKTGYDLWADFYPYRNPAVRTMTRGMMTYMSSKDDSEAVKATKVQKIMENIKMALFSAESLGLFKGDPQMERYRLFMDNTNPLHPNQSIASYMCALKSVKSPSAMLVNQNALISTFTYNLRKNNSMRTDVIHGPEVGVPDQHTSLFKKMEPSWFEYNNAQGADVGDDHKYMALVELMSKNEVIKDDADKPILYNGLEYTTRMLAKDLIVASYLQGGVQKATEITKFIPIPYLKASQFAAQAREWQTASVLYTKGRLDVPGATLNLEDNIRMPIWDILLGIPSQDPDDNAAPVWRVERQIVQHNPLDVPVIPKEYEDVMKGDSFVMPQGALDSMDGYAPPFLHYRKNKTDIRLYEKDSKTLTYRRIPTLGTGGIGLSSEYSIRSKDATSITNINVFTPRLKSDPPEAPPNSGTSASKENAFKINEGNLTETLMEIKNAQIPVFSHTAEILMPFINNDTRLVIGETPGRGQWLEDNNLRTIVMGKTFLNMPSTRMEDVAQAVLHEYVHSITVNELNRYFNADGSFIEGINQGNLPAHITKLHRTFSAMVARLGPEKIQEFAKFYNANRKLRERVPGEVDDMLLYAGYSIREMLTMVMTNDELRTYLSTVDAIPGIPLTLLQRFADSLVKLMEAIGVRPGSLNAQIMEAVLETAQMQKQRRIEEAEAERAAAIAAAREAEGPDTDPGFNSDKFNLSAELAAAEAASDRASAQQAQDGPSGDPESYRGNPTMNLLPYMQSEVDAVLAEIDRC